MQWKGSSLSDFRAALTIRFLAICLALIGLTAILPQDLHADIFSKTQESMGTQITVMVFCDEKNGGVKNAVEQAFLEIDRIDRLFSTYKPQSPVSQINQAAGKSPVPIADEVFRMIAQGVLWAKQTDGAFDVTFAGAGRLYDFTADPATVPNNSAIENALGNVGIEHLVLDASNKTAFLNITGAKIGLGGYIKGYGVDRAVAVLRTAGYSDFIVNAGGDMYVAGAKGRKSWRLGIQDPRGAHDSLIGAIQIVDSAVVTSGDYERFFIHDNKRYHHILDPRTARPARMCRSVTVVADSVMEADAMATAVFVMGPQKGLAWIESKNGVECLIIDANGVWILSSGFKKRTRFEARTPEQTKP
jgi:thiamine biosynthesis lipoprotein